MSVYTYHQLEAMRSMALGMGLHAKWFGELHDNEAWLRVSRDPDVIQLCFFPGRKPILSITLQTDVALEVARAALDLVALHTTLTSHFSELVEPADCARVEL